MPENAEYVLGKRTYYKFISDKLFIFDRESNCWFECTKARQEIKDYIKAHARKLGG